MKVADLQPYVCRTAKSVNTLPDRAMGVWIGLEYRNSIREIDNLSASTDKILARGEKVNYISNDADKNPYFPMKRENVGTYHDPEKPTTYNLGYRLKKMTKPIAPSLGAYDELTNKNQMSPSVLENIRKFQCEVLRDMVPLKSIFDIQREMINARLLR